MDIIKASEYAHDAKMQISKIFVDGFYQWLHFFSKDKTKMQRAFQHMFNLDVFYIAVIDDVIAGVAACTDGKVPSVQLQSSELKKHLGFFKGTLAYYILRKQFEMKPYPFEKNDGMGMIEFVATSEKYRGQGVASTIIKRIIAETSFTEYALEVADTNTNAVKLYEKLGFSEFKRTKVKHSKRSGVNALVYMKYVKET